ncbi:hypothetical protein [Pasteurella sp. PK-2025]|uniref:COG4648 family protein n=2 Tax=Pasteurella sp. PK-2025 TaxID=3413133 RepID=UPI003C745DA7
MYKLANVFLSLLLVAYPFFVFFSLDSLPFRTLTICLFILFVLRFILVFRQPQYPSRYLKLFALCSTILGGVLALVAFMFQHENSLLFYPVLMNLLAFCVFAASLIYPPSIIEIFARIMDKNLPEHAINYTRNVTIAWCIFFIINGSAAFLTVVANDMTLWTWYNGLISYLLMGLFFIIEFGIRQYVKRKHKH